MVERFPPPTEKGIVGHRGKVCHLMTNPPLNYLEKSFCRGDIQSVQKKGTALTKDNPLSMKYVESDNFVKSGSTILCQ